MKDETTDQPKEQQGEPQPGQLSLLDETVVPLEEAPLDFANIETPAELMPAAAPVLTPEQFPPALDRERPERPPLVPKRVWISALAVIGTILVAVLAWVLIDAVAQVTVPDVTGMQLAQAKLDLEKAGLDVQVLERFSASPVGEVLSQSPNAESVARKGDVITLVVSAGTEDFTMPDVIGTPVLVARGKLEGRGLIVLEEQVTSEATSGTVLGSVPAPGATVRSGDTVRLQVATSSLGGNSLRPYSMQGLSIVIDPAPVEPGTSDVPLDVTRRLRSLLEASGATVVVLRTAETTDTSDATRATAAQSATGTVAVGLTVVPSGQAGRIVSAPYGGSASAVVSERLASLTASALTTVSPPAQLSANAADPVFQNSKMPWLRIQLGSAAERADQALFADPFWADKVARTIYTSIGEVFAVKEEL